MSIFNTVDYVVIVLLVIGGISGAIKGFLEELSQKFGLILGLLAALMFTQSFLPLIQSNINLPLWLATGLSYVLLFIAGYLLMKILGSLLQKIFESTELGFVDKLLGFFLGILEMTILVGFITMLLGKQSVINLKTYIDGSYILSNYISPFFIGILKLIQKVL